MSPARRCWPLLVLLLVVAVAPAAAPPPVPLPSQIERWIAELGDDDFNLREAASLRLRAAGPAAEPALEKAADSPDAEVKKRARTILADFRWGIYPRTPEAVVERIRKYRVSARQEKALLIRQLIAAGPAGCRAVVKIARAESDPLTRKDVFSDVSANLSRSAPALIEADHLASLEGLLELAVQGDLKVGIGHYAAYHLLTGSLPRRIAALEAQAESKVVPKAEYESLAYLYRARGDLTKALKAAAEAERNDLVEAFLYEKADWKELARRPELVDGTFWPRPAGYRAAYARLAGNEKAFASQVKEIIDRARPLAEARGDVLPYAKALLINGQTSDAVALLEKAGRQPLLVYELLTAQMKFEQAFALVKKVRKESPARMPALELARARTLHLLGARDEALAILKRYGGDVTTDRDFGWYADLVGAELAVGRREQAFAHARTILVVASESPTVKRVMDKLFGDGAAEALVLWRLVHHPQAKVAKDARLDVLRRLMEGKSAAPEIDNLMRAARNELPNSRAEQVAEQWRMLGEAAVRAKQEARAIECFRKAGRVRGTLRLGDLEAGHKRWETAATLYRQAYRLAARQMETAKGRPEVDGESLPALALFLSGHALVRAGRPAEGNRQMEQAHLLPLGDGEMRGELMRALQRRGHREAARREQELLRRTGEPTLIEPGSYFTGEGLRGAAIVASARKDWLAAADGLEQSFLRVLHPDLNFSRALAYVIVPAHSLRLRARGLATAGKLDEALREGRRALAVLPGHIELAISLAPLLEARGRKKDAAELFGSARRPYEELVRVYPKCAWAYNQMGWLSACCKHDLSTGLAHARKAVALGPGTAAYHDTLAEVLFQLGKKDEAAAAQKQALKINPRRAYFRKQLKRIEAGNPKAPRPADEEDE